MRSGAKPKKAALVVISIIAILAAMLMSALAKSHQTARKIVCLNNLKQLSLIHI